MGQQEGWKDKPIEVAVKEMAGGLKPCPFCLTEGAKLIELWDLFDAGIVAHIHCEHCGADGPSIYCEVGGVDAALARARSAAACWACS